VENSLPHIVKINFFRFSLVLMYELGLFLTPNLTIITVFFPMILLTISITVVHLLAVNKKEKVRDSRLLSS
jgi:hypothetical protein